MFDTGLIASELVFGDYKLQKMIRRLKKFASRDAPGKKRLRAKI
jgi:hypothetical protein